jgi:hypothetical protein
MAAQWAMQEADTVYFEWWELAIAACAGQGEDMTAVDPSFGLTLEIKPTALLCVARTHRRTPTMRRRYIKFSLAHG